MIRRLPAFILGFGLVLRLVNYLYNKTVWSDEYLFIYGLKALPFSKLQYPAANSGGGYLYMLLEKVMLTLFGFNELALRFFPFLFSCLSLIVFYYFLKNYTQSKWMLCIALLIFACGDNLIFYAAEIRQYSSDVFVSCAALWLFSRYKQDLKFNIKTGFMFAFVGAILIWLSHVGSVIFASLGLVLLIQAYVARASIKPVVAVGCVWAVSLISNYYFSLIKWSESSLAEAFVYYNGMYQHLYLIPSSVSELIFNVAQNFRVFCFYLGLRLTVLDIQVDAFFPFNMTYFIEFMLNNAAIIGYILSVFGVGFLLFMNGLNYIWRESKPDFYAMIIPFLFIGVLCGLEKYPYLGRHLLFIFPFFTIVIARGVTTLISHKRTLGLVMMGIFFIQPVFSSVYHLVEPRIKLDLKTPFKYIQTHRKPSEPLYIVDPYGHDWFTFYKDNYGLDAAGIFKVDSLTAIPHTIFDQKFWVLYINKTPVGTWPFHPLMSQETVTRIPMHPKHNAHLYVYKPPSLR